MKATAHMRIELPAYPNEIFTFRQMFSHVMGDFSQRVGLGVATCQHLTTAQHAMVKTAADAMKNATKLVAYGQNDLLGMEMMTGQMDCQQALEDGCRYEFDMVGTRSVAHNEMYLHFLKTAIEVVDLVAEWMNKKDDKAAKRKLSEIAQLMAQCFVLFKFAHVPSDYITQGTMLRIMPLIRFQAIGVETLDSATGDKSHAEIQHSANDFALQEARNLYMFHHGVWMAPLKERLDMIYRGEIAKLN